MKSLLFGLLLVVSYFIFIPYIEEIPILGFPLFNFWIFVFGVGLILEGLDQIKTIHF